MASKTIYPYGTGGQLPTNIGIINDLVTGGADKALSAEQGVVLNEKVSSIVRDSDSTADFDIADENGNVIFRLRGGNVKTKNFTNAPLEGFRVSVLGDSISTYDGYPGSNVPFYTGSNAGITNVNMTWWMHFCNNQCATMNRLYAYGGGDVKNNLCLQYGNLFSNGTSGNAPDYVIILAGINDWYHGVTLGSMSDAENSNTTFYAAYKFLLKNLRSTYPNATVICLTVLNSMARGTIAPYLNLNNVSIEQFNKAIVECCDYYSVSFIDLNKIININGSNYTTWLADYTHPNKDCAEMITKALCNNIIHLTCR